MPTTTPTPLARAELGISPTLVYTAPAATIGVPRAIDICNIFAPSTRLLSVWVVPAGGSPDNTNAIARSLPVTHTASKGLVVLDPGDEIWGSGDDDGLTMSVFGSEVTP